MKMNRILGVDLFLFSSAIIVLQRSNVVITNWAGRNAEEKRSNNFFTMVEWQSTFLAAVNGLPHTACVRCPMPWILRIS